MRYNINIFITGATGLIGQALVKQLHEHNVIVLTRNKLKATELLSTHIEITEDLSSIDFNNLDVVINLSGEPIADKRWTSKQKNIICNSRWTLTKDIADRINSASNPPKVFISGSAVGFYGRQSNISITEKFTNINEEFTHHVCQKWEDIALAAKSESTRVCVLRTGIVLDSKKGALGKMLPAFKVGLGGPIASGKQFMSWIHIDDMVQLIIHTMYTDALAGPINATAPHAISNEEFSKTLSNVLHRPCFFRVPHFILKCLLGELADLLLYGQHVVPDKLLKHGFSFKFSSLEPALDNLLTVQKS